jgi:hypothetical protein
MPGAGRRGIRTSDSVSGQLWARRSRSNPLLQVGRERRLRVKVGINAVIRGLALDLAELIQRRLWRNGVARLYRNIRLLDWSLARNGLQQKQDMVMVSLGCPSGDASQATLAYLTVEALLCTTRCRRS